MSLERAISERRFAYGEQASNRQMRPPPATLSLQAVSQSVGLLFERAFVSGGTRPKPEEWVSALTELNKNTRQCTRNIGHYFLGSLSSCPWCEIETKIGISLFYAATTRIANVQASFNITATWMRIVGIQPPDAPPLFSIGTNVNVQPSETVLKHRGPLSRRVYSGIVALIVGGLLIFAGVCNVAIAPFIIGMIIMIGGGIAYETPGSVKVTCETVKQVADSNLAELQARWKRETSNSPFFDKLKALETCKSQYEGLPGVRAKRLHVLESEKKSRQFKKHLDSFRIADAVIPNIGPNRKATLASYGIETAADVKEQAITAIPGFGPSIAFYLDWWRKSVEAQFVFNASSALDPKDVADIDRDISLMRSKLEQELLDGPNDLQQIKERIITQRNALQVTIEQASKALLQAECDLKALNVFKPL